MSMAATAAGSASPTAESAKKKARLNPARRKSAKAKSPAEGTTCSAKDSVSQLTSGSGTTSNAKTTSTPKSKKQSSVIAERSQPQADVAKRTPAPRADSGANHGNSDHTNQGRVKALAVASPAMVTGGLVGCAAGAAVILGAGLWKNMAGVDSAILAARTAKLCVDNLIEEVITSLKAGTYSGAEAIDVLRRTTLAYASTIPGGAPFVERLFQEVQLVRKQRGNEVDRVLAEASTELMEAGQRGANSAELHTLICKQLVRLSAFANNATRDVIARNPTFRPYVASAQKTLRPPREAKVPTVKLNMAVKHKLPSALT
ncbi:uncharacterized protein MYCFIDRAFT_211695 [Pseudocercospora fijiensis CIRAD86]|uniref:Uncharacterized protein n=1 Tax=Pseudocercospora fijiensis (strain CIRAD86) TaxID=383855 RepID=M3A8E1_PSEFD|nr:uncharacterized protein MYCFIDRAFT_211695 [Pseudocercospora fijiensis CIRAD86]EME80886.1 hypothetical protein MYCFIDRAFT_211695 [Pseudocercospora fijiensis CIRAD86]